MEIDSLQEDPEAVDNSNILFENHVLHVCSALGGTEGDSYIPGDEAIGTMTFLISRLLARFKAFFENG